ncbi:MAG TPA: signal peptidase I [Conexibacter sp.]|nr:signal peptidase I [Conexibacter sp.]
MRRTIKQAVSAVGLAASLTLAAAVLLPAALGYQRYVITSGSMSGTYDRGSIVYTREVPTASLRVGDVITYAPPPPAGLNGLVTHRIAWIGRDRSGARAFRTKGDANPVGDPWRFTLDRPRQARAALHIPYVGFALAALGVREVRMLLIGLPALLIALGTLVRLWRKAGVELRRREAAALSDAG